MSNRQHVYYLPCLHPVASQDVAESWILMEGKDQLEAPALEKSV